MTGMEFLNTTILAKKRKIIASILLAVTVLCTEVVELHATQDVVSKPSVTAESAILMDAQTGTTMYEKDIYTKRYPASITKIMTCLVARKHAELNEVVTFSNEAVFGIERNSSNIGIDVGENMSMQDCLYAILLASANEVASAVAEHVGGSVEGFAQMMNEEALALGCQNTHFVNANGLPDEDHYTTAYDMALITRAFFADEVLAEMAGTVFYHINATMTQPDEIDLQNHHRMLVGCRYGSKYSYEYTLGGKTGYTDVARQTLVTCAQKDDMRLICVVLKDETPEHYLDTTNLMEYGFANFAQLGGESYTGVPDGLYDDAAEEEAPDAEEVVATNGGNIVIGANDTDENAETSHEKDDEKTDKEKSTDKEKRDGFSIVKMLVITVCLLAVCVCGFFLFIEYKKEQERKRRRAAIMERHRARRREEER